MRPLTKPVVVRILILLVLAGFYLLILRRSWEESRDRSFQMREPAKARDYVLVKVRVVSVDVRTGEVVASLDFLPAGKFGKDEETPRPT